MHVQLLCSPELPPELAEAKQSMTNLGRPHKGSGQQQQQQVSAVQSGEGRRGAISNSNARTAAAARAAAAAGVVASTDGPYMSTVRMRLSHETYLAQRVRLLCAALNADGQLCGSQVTDM
jgi:hypothetical protein